MALSIKESSVCAQVGQVALGACHAVWSPGNVLAAAAAKVYFSSGHVWIASVVIFRPEAVLLSDAKKAGEWRIVPDAESFLMEACARNLASWVVATWMKPPRHSLREVCIC